MRPWFIVALLLPVLTLGCATLSAEPAFVQPKRSLPLQIEHSYAYENGLVTVVETVWLKPYPVKATGGLSEIRQELDEVGPKSDVVGRRFDGLTTWGLHWGFVFDNYGTSCSLRSAIVEVEAVITLPELTHPDSLPDGETELWGAYLQQLRAHEDGHVNIYRVGAQELSNEFIEVGEMPDCDELRKTLKALGEAKIERISQADRYFDLQTGHGAVFPRKE
jgi:predicted secreted Zn-dependent protease